MRGKEGGHSEFRILHHKDITGFEIERALVEEAKRHENIQIHNHWFVLDLITQHHMGMLVTKSTPDIECYGVYALNTQSNKIEKILSKVTVLAAGGVGQVYRTTTNPKITTGDGIAMAYRAKARIEKDVYKRQVDRQCLDRCASEIPDYRQRVCKSIYWPAKIQPC